jgi:hypothetical protein
MCGFTCFGKKDLGLDGTHFFVLKVEGSAKFYVLGVGSLDI